MFGLAPCIVNNILVSGQKTINIQPTVRQGENKKYEWPFSVDKSKVLN